MFSEQCTTLYSQLTPRPEAIQLVQHAGGADNAYVVSGGGQDELRGVFANHKIAHHFAGTYECVRRQCVGLGDLR